MYEFVNESCCREIGLDRQTIPGRTGPEVWGKRKSKPRIKQRLDDCFGGSESHDISARKDLQSRIIHFENKDSTTGHFNRRSFDIVLDMEREKARRSRTDKIRAILFVTLRDFTRINARYGYEVGDLLMEAAGV